VFEVSLPPDLNVSLLSVDVAVSFKLRNVGFSDGCRDGGLDRSILGLTEGTSGGYLDNGLDGTKVGWTVGTVDVYLDGICDDTLPASEGSLDVSYEGKVLGLNDGRKLC